MGKKEDALKAWGLFVGNISPREFMLLSTGRTGNLNAAFTYDQITRETRKYTKDLPRMFPDYKPNTISEEWSDQQLLEAYIKNDCHEGYHNTRYGRVERCYLEPPPEQQQKRMNMRKEWKEGRSDE